MSNLGVAFAKVFPSFHPLDILFGLALAGVMRLVLYVKSKNKKKFRQGEEYGSAVWRTEKPHSAVRACGAENLTAEKKKPSETLTEHFRELVVIQFQ